MAVRTGGGGPVGGRTRALRRCVALAAGLVPFAPVLPPAAAQVWQTAFSDDGAWYQAQASAPGAALGIGCGGPSPQGRPVTPGDTSWNTDAGTVMLWLNLPRLRPPQDVPQDRGDLALIVNGTGYRLPAAHWDTTFSVGWLQTVGYHDPLLAAIAAAQQVTVVSGSGVEGTVPAAGAGAAMGAVLRFCHARATAPRAAPRVDLRAAVEADILRTCGDPADRGPNWLREADIDGDGTPDLLLHWMEVRCRTPGKIGMCSPSTCDVAIYLSSQFPVTGRPQDVMATGYDVVRLPDGRTGVRTTEAHACGSLAFGTCVTTWIWNGQNMQGLQ